MGKGRIWINGVRLTTKCTYAAQRRGEGVAWEVDTPVPWFIWMCWRAVCIDHRAVVRPTLSSSHVAVSTVDIYEGRLGSPIGTSQNIVLIYVFIYLILSFYSK